METYSFSPQYGNRRGCRPQERQVESQENCLDPKKSECQEKKQLTELRT